MDGSGNWSVILTGLNANSTHPLTARTTDVAGNAGPVSATFNLVIDNTAPVAPVIASITPDTGAADGRTTATSVTVNGTAPVSEAGALVQLFDNNVAVGSPVVISGTGTWSVPISGLAVNSTHPLTARITDGAGNLVRLRRPLTW